MTAPDAMTNHTLKVAEIGPAQSGRQDGRNDPLDVVADAGAGNDTVRAAGIRADSNEVAVEGFMDYTDDG